MSPRFLPPCLLVVFAAAPAAAQEGDTPSYEALMERVKKSDPKVDFAALRMAFTKTRADNPYDRADRATRSGMRAALARKDYAKALEHAEKCLKKNPLDIEAHGAAWRPHTELKNADKARSHGYVRDGLVLSILKSGDGKTPKTAHVVIATDEEYAVLAALRIKFKRQALIRDGGHFYDRLDGVSEATGKEVATYFNIDRPFKWLGEWFK